MAARATFLFAAGVLGLSCLQAGEAEPETATTETPPATPAPPGTIEAQNSAFRRIRSWSDAQLAWLYENLIVDAQGLHKFSFKPKPHIKDMFEADYWRLDVRLFYGFAQRVEGEVEFANYFADPRSDADRYGVAQVRGNLRYRWVPNADPTGKATTGIEIVRPFTSAPAELVDGVNRFSLYCSYARVSTRFRDTQEFLNLSYTLVTPSSAPGSISPEKPQDDFISLGLGVLQSRGDFTYGLSAAWDHVVDGRVTDFLTITPSVTWSVPRRFTSWTPGSWQIGVALTGRRLDGDDDYKVKIRVRWLVKVREIFRGRRHEADHTNTTAAPAGPRVGHHWNDGDGARA